MRVILSKMLAIGAGLIVSIGVATAQPPAAQPAPIPAPAAQPAPVPAAQPAPVVVTTAPAAGCGSCGTATSGCSSCGDSKHGHSRFKDVFCIGKGTTMPVTCACTSAQRSFIFGSCNQFYNPGNDCRHCGFGRGDCRNPVGGAPAGPVPPCTYSSYTVR